MERDRTHEHDPGTYAEGLETDTEAPDTEHVGDFAEGQQAGHSNVHDLRGDFAEGQEELERESEPRGDYATGLEHDPDPE
jgi:hypothetical protein